MIISRSVFITSATTIFLCINQSSIAYQQANLGAYTFDLVGTSNQQIQYVQSPKLSNDGAIAYRTFSYDGSSAIYFSDGGTPQKVIGSDYVVGNRRIDYINPEIDMNNNHVIAFATSYTGTIDNAVFGVFTVTPQGNPTRISSNDPVTYFDSIGMSINDNNAVAYLGSAPSEADVYLTTPTGPKMIFRGADFHSSPTSPELNNNGQVAFGGVGDGPDELFTYSNGSVSVLDAGQPGGDQLYNKPGLNDAGEIAYVRPISLGSNQLRLYDNGVSSLLPVAGDGGGAIELNNSGIIGFYGRDEQNKNGARIYVHGTVTDVLGVGDTIFGKEVHLIDISDINDSGQLALEAEFTDGSSAILRATAVPEPTVMALLLVAGIATKFRRGRRA